MLQSLPESKRDGNTILSAYTCDLLYKASSTSRANSVLEQMKVIPELVSRLKEEPEKVQADFEEIRKHCKLSQ